MNISIRDINNKVIKISPALKKVIIKLPSVQKEIKNYIRTKKLESLKK